MCVIEKVYERAYERVCYERADERVCYERADERADKRVIREGTGMNTHISVRCMCHRMVICG